MSTIDLGTMDPALKESLRARLRQRLRERLIQRTSAAHRVGAAPPVTGATADFGPQTPLSSVDFSGLAPESEDFMGAGAQRETVNAAVRDLFARFPDQGERFNAMDARDLAQLAMREATPAAMRTMRPAPEPGGFVTGLRQGAAAGLDRMSGLPVIGPAIQEFVDETAIEQPAAGFGGFAGQAIGSLAGMANPANLPETVLSGVVGRGVGAAARPLIERVNRTLGPTAAGLIERITEEAGEEAAFGATQQAAKEDWVNDPIGAAGRTLAAAGLGGAAGAIATGGVSAGRGAARIAGRGIQAAGNGVTGDAGADPVELARMAMLNLTPEAAQAAGTRTFVRGSDPLVQAPPEASGMRGDALPEPPARRGVSEPESVPESGSAGLVEQVGGALADSTDLESMTLADLNRLARERGVTPANRRSKRAVMTAIEADRNRKIDRESTPEKLPAIGLVQETGSTTPNRQTGTVTVVEEQSSSPNRTREPWEMTREEYVALKMPSNPMGGGVNEHILARKHAIHVENAIAAGKKPSRDRVQEMAEFFNSSNSNFPPEVLSQYPELANSPEIPDTSTVNRDSTVRTREPEPPERPGGDNPKPIAQMTRRELGAELGLSERGTFKQSAERLREKVAEQRKRQVQNSREELAEKYRKSGDAISEADRTLLDDPDDWTIKAINPNTKKPFADEYDSDNWLLLGQAGRYEIIDEAQADSDRSAYDAMTERERVENDVADKYDRAKVMEDMLVERGLPTMAISGRSESRYLGDDDFKVRIAAHDPNTRWEKVNGSSDIDIDVGDDPRSEATHSAGTSIASMTKIADRVAELWKKQRSTSEDADRASVFERPDTTGEQAQNTTKSAPVKSGGISTRTPAPVVKPSLTIPPTKTETLAPAVQQNEPNRKEGATGKGGEKVGERRFTAADMEPVPGGTWTLPNAKKRWRGEVEDDQGNYIGDIWQHEDGSFKVVRPFNSGKNVPTADAALPASFALSDFVKPSTETVSGSQSVKRYRIKTPVKERSPATLGDAGTEDAPGRAVSTPARQRRKADVAPDEQSAGRATPTGTSRGSPAPRLPKRGEFSKADIERQLIREYDEYFPESGSELSDADAEQAGTDRALDRARREGDGLPLMGFLRFLHENQPPPASLSRGKRGKGKAKTPARPPLDVIDSPRDLPDGTNVSIYGRRFSVMKDDDGSVLLVEQFADADPDASSVADGPAPMIVYLDGLDRLPIDRGSYKAGGTDRISQAVEAAAESRTAGADAPGDISALPGVQRGLFGRASDGGFSGQQGTFQGLLGQPDEAEAFALPDPDADLRERFRPAEANTGRLFGEGGGSDLNARKGKGGAVASAASRIPVKPLPASASTGRAGTKPGASPGEIILDAAKAFGAGGGRVRRAKPSPGALGTYYPGSARTVIRYAGDLDVTAHELAHVLDDRYGIVAEWAVPTGTTRDGKPKYGPSPYDIELLADTFQATATKKMSKVMKRAEGVAEYIRARIVNPDAAKAAAPAFTAFIDKKLPASALRAIDTFSDQVRGFAARSASEKVISNIRVTEPKRSVAARIVDAFRGTDPDQWSFTLKDELEAQLDDSFAPVYKAAALAIRLRGLEPLLPSRNPKTLIKNFAGFDAKFADVLDRGPIKADLSRVDGVGGLKWLLEPLGEQTPESMEADYRGVITLLSAERVVEKADNLVKAADMVEALINERDALQKMPPTDIIDDEVTVAERIKEIAREIRTESRKVGYTGAEGKIREWANERKERLAGFGAGLEPDDRVARDAVAEIKNGDPARYLRLRQAADRYRAFADAGLRYAVAKGRLSKEAYDSIVEANQFYAAFNRVMDDPGEEPGGPGIGGGGGAGKGRNLARRQSVTERFKGSTRQIDNPYVNLLTNTHRIMRESDANEAIVSLVNLLDSKREIYKGEPIDLAQIGSKARKGDDKVITVYRKGQAEQWQFAEPVRAALSDWYEIGEENLAFRALAAMNQFAKASITLSPGFAARQQFRDPVARTILSESGSKPLDHMYFIVDRQGRAEFKEVQSEFNRAGGGLFGHYGVGKEAYYRELDSHIRTGGKDKRTVLSTAQALGRGYTSLLQASETLGRLAEYRKAKAKAMNDLGYGDLDASLYAAGEARGLQDFAQAGRLIRRLNRYVLFLNPMIRGLSRSISGARRNPGRFAARMAIYSIAPSIAFKVLGMMSGWDDDLKREPAYYRDFFWNAKIGPELWLRIPKPFELGIPGSAVERGIDWMRGVDRPFDGFLNSSVKAVTVDPEAFLGPLKPLVEITANHDFFKGRTIVPEYEVGLDVSLRDGAEKATRVGKIIGDVLRVDPRYIDQAIHGVAPGLGRVVTSAADTGRTDRPSRVPLAARLSGVVGATSADGIPDVRYVLDEARRKGRSADRPYANLQNLLKQWRTESDPAKRVKLYNTIAERAKALRGRVDGETLKR